MITRSHPAHTLVPGFLLAACVALPAGANAQTAPPITGTGSLSAAMAEAHRSPFHNATGVERLVMVQLAGVPVPRAGDRPAPDSARGPGFHRVFWPTLGGVFLGEFAFLAGVMSYDGNFLLMGTAALILGPPTASRIAGGSFAKGVLGSAAGLGVGWALFRLGMAVGLDDSVAYWGIPTAHALLTTALAIR